MIDIGIAVKNIVAIPQKYVLPESTCSLLPFSDETARAAQSSAIVPARICIGNRIVIVTTVFELFYMYRSQMIQLQT